MVLILAAAAFLLAAGLANGPGYPGEPHIDNVTPSCPAPAWPTRLTAGQGVRRIPPATGLRPWSQRELVPRLECGCHPHLAAGRHGQDYHVLREFVGVVTKFDPGPSLGRALATYSLACRIVCPLSPSPP